VCCAAVAQALLSDGAAPAVERGRSVTYETVRFAARQGNEERSRLARTQGNLHKGKLEVKRRTNQRTEAQPVMSQSADFAPNR
jgi:hypothetical protein